MLEPGAVDRNEDPVRKQATACDQRADVEAHDVADRDERRRQAEAEVTDGTLAKIPGDCQRFRRKVQSGCRELEESAGERRKTQPFRASGRTLADLEHLGGGYALGKL